MKKEQIVNLIDQRVQEEIETYIDKLNIQGKVEKIAKEYLTDGMIQESVQQTFNRYLDGGNIVTEDNLIQCIEKDRDKYLTKLNPILSGILQKKETIEIIQKYIKEYYIDDMIDNGNCILGEMIEELFKNKYEVIIVPKKTKTKTKTQSKKK